MKQDETVFIEMLL